MAAPHRRYPLHPPRKGRCRFCGQECAPNRTWHDRCGDLYDLTKRPERARVRLAQRDGCVCRACGCSKDSPAYFEVDHIIPLALGRHLPVHEARRLYLLGNMQLLCGACHAAKTEDDRRIIRAVRRGAMDIRAALELYAERGRRHDERPRPAEVLARTA